MRFMLETKSGSRSVWKKHPSYRRFDTESEAVAFARSWDQDGQFNPRSTRVVPVREEKP